LTRDGRRNCAMILVFEHADDEFFEVSGAFPDVVRFGHQILSEITRAFSMQCTGFILIFVDKFLRRAKYLQGMYLYIINTPDFTVQSGVVNETANDNRGADACNCTRCLDFC
jgi:hypothetical protein